MATNNKATATAVASNNNKATVQAVADKATAHAVADKATVQAVAAVPTGAVGVALVAGATATVHGVAFVVPVAGCYHAPRGANAGWPVVPEGSGVHVCDAVQLATASAPAAPATVLVHGQPAVAGRAGLGAMPGHYVARPYTGAQRWQLHVGAPKV